MKRRLSPYIGPTGLLRVHGRTHLLESATFGTKLPLILDARHHLVRLFLQHLHGRHCHHGADFLKGLTQHNISILNLCTTLSSIHLK